MIATAEANASCHTYEPTAGQSLLNTVPTIVVHLVEGLDGVRSTDRTVGILLYGSSHELEIYRIESQQIGERFPEISQKFECFHRLQTSDHFGEWRKYTYRFV